MKKSILIAVVIILIMIVAGGSFYMGIIYSKNHRNQPSFNDINLQGIRNNKTNNFTGGNFISGEIISKDGDSLNLKLSNNEGSKIIFYSTTTQIYKFASASLEDITTGTSLSVTGITNTDGSITAQSIQIRPADQSNPNF